MAKQATQQANYLAHFSKAKSIKINEKHQFENTTPDTVQLCQVKRLMQD
ncbi:hypothetical protein P303_01665 [Xylella fastidiosa MUL0034]|nr:hypothetical protein P303_01665 [Xylella fastidiosa MUL0034]